MKRLVLLFLTTMIVSYTMAQQQITISEIAGGGRLKHSSAIGTVITSVDKFDTKQNIDLKPDPYIVAGITYKLFDPSGNDITQTIQGQKINGIASGPILKLEVKLNGFTYSIPDIGKNLSATPVTSTPGGTTKSTSPTPSFTASGYFQGTSFPAPLADLNFMKTGRRYFSGADRAAIILDEKGKLIGNVPVNLDQDDRIFIYLIVPKVNVEDYDVEVVGGEYAPTDLQIRSYDVPTSIAVQGTLPPTQWTAIVFERGPYTSETVTFNIKKLNTLTNANDQIATYTVRINKLYHVAVGASFISTGLAKPEFDVFPTATGSTINKINDGTRTMATFNVIWYWWSTVKYLSRGSDLTRGRDVLKEPDFLRRLNPTFGVALDNTFKENFFLGAAFEFARGGSITAGGHYGKIQKLADPTFVLGQTPFTGTKNDIKLTNSWEWVFLWG